MRYNSTMKRLFLVMVKGLTYLRRWRYRAEQQLLFLQESVKPTDDPMMTALTTCLRPPITRFQMCIDKIDC